MILFVKYKRFFTERVLWGMKFLAVLTITSVVFLTILFTLSNPSKTYSQGRLRNTLFKPI